MNNLTKFLCLNALLIGSTSLAMDDLPAMALKNDGWDADLSNELCEATRCGNLAQVEALLNAGASVNARDDYGDTPLIAAVRESHIDVCRLLLNRNAQVDDERYGQTALIYAAEMGNTEICQLLIDNKAQLNRKESGCWTPLMHAAHKRNTATCKLIIDATIKLLDKTPAIALLGIKRFNKATDMKMIDRNVIQLIAYRLIEAENFAQINKIENKYMHAYLSTYALQQLKLRMDPKTNQGNSHE